MTMQPRIIRKRQMCAVAGAWFAAASIAAPGAALAEWTKTYVVEWDEPAVYFGGEHGQADPGADCPKGVNPDPDLAAILVRAGYSREQAEWLLDPDNTTLTWSQRHNQLAFRGKDRANVYVNPSSTPDPGMVEVAGKIGEGINLDGNMSTGFTSPTGEKGVDNNFYRALGCVRWFRGRPYENDHVIRANDRIHAGLWTVVMVVSGKGDDPMNDDEVSIGVYLSSDKLMKDGAGHIARGATFRIKPHERYEAIFKGVVVDGRITTEASPEILIRDAEWGRGMDLLEARADFQMQSDGSLKGYIGGYRPWEPIYVEFYAVVSGGIIETHQSIELPAVWYALRRNADHSPTGPGGEKTHISYAARIDAAPAYVTEPEGEELVSSVKSYKAVAPKGEPDIYLQRTTNPVRTIEGLMVETGPPPPARRAPAPLTDEELQPPSAWLERATFQKGDS